MSVLRIARWADAPEDYRVLFDAEWWDWMAWSTEPIIDRLPWLNRSKATHTDGTHIIVGNEVSRAST